jgi:hypothetical protein
VKEFISSKWEGIVDPRIKEQRKKLGIVDMYDTSQDMHSKAYARRTSLTGSAPHLQARINCGL